MTYREPDRKVDVGNVLAGLFLGCFGLFGVLLGGGCGLMLLSELSRNWVSGLGWFMLLALAIFGGGCVALWQGIKMLRGRD
jgi:hypothetical protein